MDANAELAHEEMFRLTEETQKKHHVTDKTMNYICADLAQCYAIKTIARAQLTGEDIHIRIPGKTAINRANRQSSRTILR